MAADYISIIKSVIDPLVKDPESLLIRCMDKEEDSPRDVNYLICCSSDELGKLIGKRGAVADAIRTIVNVKARDEHQRVHIKFESFDSDEASN